MARQRLPLNLYLLKRGASPSDAVPLLASPAGGGTSPGSADGGSVIDAPAVRTWILGGEPTEAPLPVSTGDPASLLIRAIPAENPWHALITAVVPDASLGDAQMNLGALLFQPVGSDTVVWSFGNAWSLLDAGQTVERFGLRVGLNALLTAKAPLSGAGRSKAVGVRGLTSAIRAAVVRKSTVVTARPSSPTAMERVDQSSDAASMAELTTHHKTFDRVAAGRSLRFEAPVGSLADLAGYAKEALRLHSRSDYQTDEAYKWIDYTVPVGDRGEVDEVLDQLLVQATSSSPIVVDLIWADADKDTGMTPAFVCFPRERSGSTASRRTEMTWAVAQAWLAANVPGRPGSEVLRTRVRFFIDGAPPSLACEVELWQLLISQISIGSDTCMISDGEVWRASKSHIADIDNLLAPRVTVNPARLPAYTAGEREGAYNLRAAAHGGHFLLDKKLVHLPGQTPFEPCDLLSHDGLFMHVKRKTSSGTMSHVVAQAMASTQLLRSEPQARTLLDNALLAQAPALPTLSAMQGHVASFASRPTGTVQVVIVGTWRGTPDVTQLPLLTRISLNSWLRQMPCESGIVLVGT